MPLAGHGIARLRDVTTRSISPENLDGDKGGGGRASEGTGAYAARDLGPGWKVSPSVIDRRRRNVADGRDRRSRRRSRTSGSRPATTTGAPGAALLLGRRGRAGDRGATRRLLLPTAGAVRPGQLLADRRQPARRLQQLLGDALPAQRHAHRREPGHDADAQLLLPGDYELDPTSRWAAYLHAQCRRNNPLTAGDVHTLLDGVARSGPLRRHLPRLGRQHYRLVGRG